MKTDQNEPIYPEKDWANVPTFGLTKREYFVAMAMQGLCALPIQLSINEITEFSVRVADALIVELNKE
jgi:hypothetical protein